MNGEEKEEDGGMKLGCEILVLSMFSRGISFGWLYAEQDGK